MNKTVLLVEDDKWLAECYIAWLNGFGYSPIWAQDAQVALDVLDSQQIDLIVLDIMLPFANGVQLLNVLASHVDLMRIPVVVCSSMVPEGLRRQYGVRTVLDKSVLTPGLMHSTLAGALTNAPI